jgi:Mor family transcriptional regulator
MSDKGGTIEELRGVIGDELMDKFVEHYAGSGIYVPKVLLVEEKHKLIREEYKQGTDYKTLSSKYGYTERHIRRICRI